MHARHAFVALTLAASALHAQHWPSYHGDQGCGYRCIDEWAAERAKRLAERRDRGNSPFVDRAREMARAAAAPAADSPFIDRAREMARGEERVGTVVTSLLERFRRGAAGSVQQSLLDKFRRSAS